MVYILGSEILGQFYVFNPEYGSKDGEEDKKLLFYYPKTDPLDTQIQNVGFCEAVVKFSDNFTNGESSYHQVNTEKELHVYSCFEEKFLIGATFSKAAALEKKYFLHGKALNNCLIRAYETFRLFFGRFTDVLRKGGDGEAGIKNLKERLDYFYTRYLMSLKLSPIPLMDALQWISYMKVDPPNYLKAQTLIDRTLEIFPSIRHYLFLYNDRLLIHNLSMANLPCLYRYLIHNLLPLSLRSELQPEYGVKSSDPNMVYSHGKFITGPGSDIDLSKGGLKLPSIFLLDDDASGSGDIGSESRDQVIRCGSVDLSEYYLIVYRALNATLAMLVPIDHSSSLDSDFFHNLDSAVGVQLTSLASNLVDLYGKEREEQVPHQYIYYNSVNLALTSSLSEGGQPIPPEMAAAICDFRDKMMESDYFGDMVAKGDGDFWLAAKKAGQRELYVLAYHKNANLTDVHEEIKRFCSAVFENVFLLE